MLGIKEHTDSILFLKGKIYTLKTKITKAKESALQLKGDVISAVTYSNQAIGFQYELESTETLLQLVKHSMKQLKKLTTDHITNE